MVGRVTSKLQVTVPKAIADRYGITPGTELAWLEAGDAIRVVPQHASAGPADDVELRLRLFDEATRRQRAREARRTLAPSPDRGWTRDELYERGVAR